MRLAINFFHHFFLFVCLEVLLEPETEFIIRDIKNETIPRNGQQFKYKRIILDVQERKVPILEFTVKAFERKCKKSIMERRVGESKSSTIKRNQGTNPPKTNTLNFCQQPVAVYPSQMYEEQRGNIENIIKSQGTVGAGDIHKRGDLGMGMNGSPMVHGVINDSWFVTTDPLTSRELYINSVTCQVLKSPPSEEATRENLPLGWIAVVNPENGKEIFVNINEKRVETITPVAIAHQKVIIDALKPKDQGNNVQPNFSLPVKGQLPLKRQPPVMLMQKKTTQPLLKRALPMMPTQKTTQSSEQREQTKSLRSPGSEFHTEQAQSLDAQSTQREPQQKIQELTKTLQKNGFKLIPNAPKFGVSRQDESDAHEKFPQDLNMSQFTITNFKVQKPQKL